MFFEFICPFLAHNLECCCQSQQKQEAVGPFRPSVQSSAPTSGWTCENQGYLQPLLALHDRTPVPGEHLVVCHDSVRTLELRSHDLVISGLNPTHGLGLGKSMWSHYLASDSLVAGQGADCVGGQNSKVFSQMQLLQENGAGHLSWLDYPVSSCYLGRAIITMFLGPPVVILPSGGVGEGGGDRCSKGSTFSKSTEFHFG